MSDGGPEGKRGRLISRRGVVRTVVGLTATSLIGGVADELFDLGVDPLYALARIATRTTKDFIKDASKPDPEEDYKRQKARELLAHVKELGGLERAYPSLMPSPERLEMIDWLLRRDTKGMASPVKRYNLETNPTSDGNFNLEYHSLEATFRVKKLSVGG